MCRQISGSYQIRDGTKGILEWVVCCAFMPIRSVEGCVDMRAVMGWMGPTYYCERK